MVYWYSSVGFVKLVAGIGWVLNQNFVFIPYSLSFIYWKCIESGFFVQ
jgi:hypothetical protein